MQCSMQGITNWQLTVSGFLEAAGFPPCWPNGEGARSEPLDPASVVVFPLLTTIDYRLEVGSLHLQL